MGDGLMYSYEAVGVVVGQFCDGGVDGGGRSISGFEF